MPRVEWSRRTADEVETVLGVMLCRANPAATRVRPSQGDRGVDVYIPAAGKWTVYQVKSFTGALTSSHKRQITKSYNRFRELVTERSLDVSEWYVIRPENPTWEDEEWLKGLTRGAPYPCSWQGLDHCEALAADHQSVIDYYLFDGKQRLQDALRDLLSALGSVEAAADLTQPGNAYAGLRSIHAAVNAHDPQYRYDFSVDEVVPGELPPIVNRPGLVASVTQRAGRRAVTFTIFARYTEATSDRPVPTRFRLTAQPGTAEADALRDFVEYGIPLAGARVTAMHMDLPGGLGESSDEGTITLGPARLDTARGAELQLVVFDEAGVVELAAADLMMDPATTGLDGQRFSIFGRERFGVFDIAIKVDPQGQRMHIAVNFRDITGTVPADVLPGLSVLAALRPPNQFVIRLRNGPALDEPRAIPRSFVGGVEPFIDVCEALATIQRNTVLPVRVPDLTETTVDEMDEWFRVARLLRGDTLEFTWNRVAVELHEDAGLPEMAVDAFAAATTSSLVVNVGGTEIDLGLQLAQLAAARVDPSEVREGGSASVHLIPAADNTGTIRWIGRQPRVGGGDPATAG